MHIAGMRVRITIQKNEVVKDKYGNQGTIHGTVTQSSATAPITVRLNNTVVNRNNRLVTITGTAWGYETIRITVTGAGGASETTTITGSGDYEGWFVLT